MQTQQTTSPASERLARTLAALLLAVSLCLPSLGGCAGIESVANGGSAASSQQVSTGSATAKLSDIPEYSGALCIDVKKGQPGFSADDAARGSFMEFSELDFEGRCGTAAGLIGPETVSNAERGDISQVHPSGWIQHRYSFVDREMLYNRSHLIAHQLCGEDANERNLITGTRTMNAVGMTYYEELVGNYVRRTNNHVLYRVTPLFAANDLVARGVQMEAESVEDGGRAIRFNVFVYNVEPGVKIDYVTGDNWESSEIPAVTTKGEATTTRGTSGDAALSQYAASKGGILSYTKNVANRLAPQGICNSVDPGGVLTELNRPVMDDAAMWERIMQLTPLRRWAEPDEIAEWVYFVGVTNRFMTGQNLLIDGGEAGAAEFVWPED